VCMYSRNGGIVMRERGGFKMGRTKRVWRKVDIQDEWATGKRWVDKHDRSYSCVMCNAV
jgi:hypothetical protein